MRLISHSSVTPEFSFTRRRTSSPKFSISAALALPRSDPFDLVFADPPYSAGSGTAVVAAVAKASWLAPGGWLSVETSRDDAVESGDLIIDTTRDVGRARLTLLRRP